MELWIRSQDRNWLNKIDRVWADEEGYVRCNITLSNYTDLNFLLLGKYKTKKRALEVLDEINKIKYYKYMAELDWVSFVNSVLKGKPMEEQQLLLSMMNTYNMPKE